MKKIIFITAMILSLLGCSLSHKNPLDSSNVEIPKSVIGIELFSSSPQSPEKYVEIHWEKLTNVEGYYIYRAMIFDGQYEKIATIPNSQGNNMIFRDNSVFSNNFYYYKMSAYNSQGLEGHLSGFLRIFVE